MIKGKEILLRHVQAAEVETLVDLMNNPDFKGEFTRTLLKSPSLFKKDFELNGFSAENSELFVICNNENEILGTIGHFSTVNYSSARELGFSVFKSDSRGKGYASEAVQLITSYLFENFYINRIQICMPTEHLACEKVAINSGFTKEGIIRGSIFVRGKFLDTYLYSMLRAEYEKNT